MKDEKYVVLSRAKIEGSAARLIDEPNTDVMIMTDWIVPDAVVIRLQDVFASGALYTYANSIAVALAVLRGHDTDPAQVDRLQEVADYFAQAAEESAHLDRKLPD